jgi:hypothetical protein
MLHNQTPQLQLQVVAGERVVERGGDERGWGGPQRGGARPAHRQNDLSGHRFPQRPVAQVKHALFHVIR